MAPEPAVEVTERPQSASELTTLCLPDANVQNDRAYAYSAAISVMVLLTGIFGAFRKPLQFVLQPEVNDEPIPILIETPPPQTVQKEPEPAESQERSDSTAETTPTVTIVAADPAAVSFAVPVTGNVLVGPARLATAPPLNNVAMHTAAAAPTPVVFTGAENRNDFPYPVYPLEARRRGMAGRMILRVVVDASGNCKSVEVKESCGHSFLDSFAADWVKRRWNWQSGNERHLEVPFTFALAGK